MEFTSISLPEALKSTIKTIVNTTIKGDAAKIARTFAVTIEIVRSFFL